MDNVHSIKNFKNTKQLKLQVTHLKAILKVVDLSIKGLTTFEVYVPVHTILITLREQKRILEAHLKQITNILDDKGKI